MVKLPSLIVDEIILPLPELNSNSLLHFVRNNLNLIFLISGNKINLLDDKFNLLESLNFELAFPIHSSNSSSNSIIQSISYDKTSGKLAACSNGRIGIWEPVGKSSWRIHSSFTSLHSITFMDYARGRIALGGSISTLSVWELDESQAFPRWSILGSNDVDETLLSVKLSPAGQLLATLAVSSNIVRIYNVGNNDLMDARQLELRSTACHSLPLRNMEWRTTDDPAESGPILYTTTRDGAFHIWGCMIDEPDFFSLWETLDVHTSNPLFVPLSTSYLKTEAMWPESEVENASKKKGTRDEFVTVLSDGSVYLTRVSNFDCRPPTCLSQSTILLRPNLYHSSHLPNLRHTILIASLELDSPLNFSLVSRCSRGTILRASKLSTNEYSFDSDDTVLPKPSFIDVNLTGIAKKIIASYSNDALLAIGSHGILQSWESAKSGLQQTFVSDLGIDGATAVATWNQGRMLVTANSKGLKIFELQQSSGRLSLISHLPDFISPLTAFCVAKISLESTRTTIVAVTRTFKILTWTYDSSIRKAILGLHHDFLQSRSNDTPIRRYCKAVSVPRVNSIVDGSTVALLLLDEHGFLTFWEAGLADLMLEWKEGATIQTDAKAVTLLACNCDGVSAIVSRDVDSSKLSIWDSKSSEFASGEQFSRILDVDVLDLKWSPDGLTLALATEDKILLYCAQRLDDLSGSPSWISYAEIKPVSLTASPIVAISWISNALAVSTGRHLLFYSSLLSTGKDCHQVAADLIGPLPMHHPQLLFQSLLHGETAIVIKILIGLAAQLTDEGDLTPLVNGAQAGSKITVDDFLQSTTAHNTAASVNHSKDIFSALTEADAQQRGIKTVLTEEDERRLTSALQKNSMKGLTKIEHAHLSVLVKTVYEIQRQQGSLDSNGLYYLVSMRSFFIYNATSVSILPSSSSTSQIPKDARTVEIIPPRLKFRDVVWAFHSESQDVLVEASIKACPAEKLTWENAKALGVFLWLKSPALLATQMETVGKVEYIKNEEARDPISASLFYLALRKKHIVSTLWKQAGGHSDQRSMLKFLVNDFELPRWKSAALKNAFVLMSNRRFLFAAVFFLLGDSLKDVVSVCLRQLDDFQLAIAITRVYEGEDGPVFKSILEGTVLPLAFRKGYRWLASWAFWKLNRRDLSIQTIVTPLRDLAEGLPYKFETIGSPLHEDPCLVLLFAQLRTWSLQTVKGAIAIPGHTEFKFVLHMSRVLCRMGCHVLALKLIHSWTFYQPPAARRPSLKNSLLNRHSLRRMSTVMDIDIPSNLGSRAPSPDREGGAKEEYHSVLKKIKVETKAPAEFDFNNFQF